MKLYLIRHGETTGDIEGRFGGDYEDHLTQKGREQSKKLANKLKDKNIEIIYHSPRIRATETAQILSDELGVPTEVAENIRERNGYGVLTGLTQEEARERCPEDLARYEADHIFHDDISGVEQYQVFQERILDAFESITKENKFNTIAIVTHGGPIRCLVRDFFELGEMKDLGDCSYLEISKRGSGIGIEKLFNAEIKG